MHLLYHLTSCFLKSMFNLLTALKYYLMDFFYIFVCFFKVKYANCDSTKRRGENKSHKKMTPRETAETWVKDLGEKNQEIPRAVQLNNSWYIDWVTRQKQQHDIVSTDNNRI